MKHFTGTTFFTPWRIETISSLSNVISVEKRAFKQASWLAMFKFVSQTFSWASTIVIARSLVPEDYGLMAMSTLITGYAALFSELGLGAAIIQRPNLTRDQLSSVFWFSFLISIIFASGCFAASFLTAAIFNEPRVVPLTKTVSAIFIISGLQIVPLNLLKKEMNFKTIGLMEVISALVSCFCMVFMAYSGFGVWTLLLGNIILHSTRLVQVFTVTRWFPIMTFQYRIVKEMIGFGAIVSLGGSFRYLFEKSDRFFAGRVWSANGVGFYSFALQLAQIPTNKIVSLIIQVSFPAFSKLQLEKEKFNTFYLDVTKVIVTIVLPLFIGASLVGDELINVLLNDQWYSIIGIFKMLCIAQIFSSMAAINNTVYMAKGSPLWRLYFHGACALFMSISFFIAVQYGMNAMIIPWLTTFPVICIVSIGVTLRKLDIGLSRYLRTVFTPLMATVVMALSVFLSSKIVYAIPREYLFPSLVLSLKVTAGCIGYVLYLFLFDLKFIKQAVLVLRT